MPVSVRIALFSAYCPFPGGAPNQSQPAGTGKITKFPMLRIMVPRPAWNLLRQCSIRVRVVSLTPNPINSLSFKLSSDHSVNPNNRDRDESREQAEVIQPPTQPNSPS